MENSSQVISGDLIFPVTSGIPAFSQCHVHQRCLLLQGKGRCRPCLHKNKKVLFIRLMAEILHPLRLVVYPIIYRVSAPSQVVQDFSHQEYLPILKRLIFQESKHQTNFKASFTSSKPSTRVIGITWFGTS